MNCCSYSRLTSQDRSMIVHSFFGPAKPAYPRTSALSSSDHRPCVFNKLLTLEPLYQSPYCSLRELKLGSDLAFKSCSFFFYQEIQHLSIFSPQVRLLFKNFGNNTRKDCAVYLRIGDHAWHLMNAGLLHGFWCTLMVL